MHSVLVPRDADIGDQSSSRSSLQSWNGFRLEGGHSCLDATTAVLTQDLAKPPKLFHVAKVYRKLVVRGSLFRALRKRPLGDGIWACMEDLIGVRSGQIRGKRHVE